MIMIRIMIMITLTAIMIMRTILIMIMIMPMTMILIIIMIMTIINNNNFIKSNHELSCEKLILSSKGTQTDYKHSWNSWKGGRRAGGRNMNNLRVIRSELNRLICKLRIKVFQSVLVFNPWLEWRRDLSCF